ncbi:MAG: ligase-associated DNA damage response endonuclease PdeM [Flavitalea sp.]
MQAPRLHSLRDQKLWLSHERGIYWEEEKALIVSDLHFGKTGHFRKSGIPVPQNVYKHDLQRLVAMIQFFQPEKLIVVGDLFHSRENKELELFLRWRQDFPFLTIELIMGNHDILRKDWYKQAAITITPEALQIRNFQFRHDLGTDTVLVPATPDEPSYLFSGHIHPGIAIYGAGKQSLRFPCFYFTEKYCVLPAFSKFTGTYLIEPTAGDQVFAIVENRLMELRN